MGARAVIGARWFGPGGRPPPLLYRFPGEPRVVDWWRPHDVPVIITNADAAEVVLPFWHYAGVYRTVAPPMDLTGGPDVERILLDAWDRLSREESA